MGETYNGHFTQEKLNLLMEKYKKIEEEERQFWIINMHNDTNHL